MGKSAVSIKLVGVVFGLVCGLSPVERAAASVVLDARADLLAVDPNDQATALGLGEENTAFQINRMRVDIRGALSDSIAYRTRLKADNAFSADVSSIDSRQNKFIEFAYLTQTFAPTVLGDVAFAGGKIIVPVGGFESAKNPGEYYFLSKAGAEASTVLWQLGAMSSCSMSGQKVDLYITNTSEIEAVGANGAQKKMSFGGGWLGKFGESSEMQFLLQYFSEPSVGTSTGKQYFAAGTKLKFGDFDVELDWLQNLFMSSSYTVGATPSTIETRSAVASLKFASSKDFAAILKYENSDVVKAASAGGNRDPLQFWTTALALEWKPPETDKFRYHLAYAYQAASRDASVQTLTAGFRYFGEIVP